MKKCDLHIHSNFSDSDADIESIFKEAAAVGLSCIAITDHDTVDGLVQAKKYSKIYNIELIEAIEMSAEYNETEVHILGYFVDSSNREFKAELAKIKELRRQRLGWMADKLNSLGVEIDKQELFLNIKEAVPTRLHLALQLKKKGKVATLREAFKKYLSPGKPAYQARLRHSVKEAIKFIKGYGGLCFLAHPHIIPNQSWVEEFISFGLDGLESVYPNMPPVKKLLYEGLALKFKILQSGGSDVHGSFKEFIKMGEVTIPYSWVEEMKKRRCIDI
ncbi:MAG: PHP domain-containing protein [Candidatus Omnitrophota bacterium]